jgi:hypothetical protein
VRAKYGSRVKILTRRHREESRSAGWKSYEEVAQYLLNQFAAAFDLGGVEGKQIVPGQSGTDWEIDAKGVLVNDVGFLIVECRRHLTSGVSQEQVGGLAYRIKDTGAHGGIVVSPLELQKGAELVAAHEGIKHVVLAPESTTTDYVLRYLNQIFLAVSDRVSAGFKESVTLAVSRPDGATETRSQS